MSIDPGCKSPQPRRTAMQLKACCCRPHNPTVSIRDVQRANALHDR
ncbi:hypothetical protein [Lysobacter gummosus]